MSELVPECVSEPAPEQFPSPLNAARPGFVVAASGTGCGKTTLTLALIEAFKRRGISPRPFKIGPDPLDSGLHAALVNPTVGHPIGHATGLADCAPRPTPGYNLDAWLHGETGCRAIFARGMASAPPVSGTGQSVAVVEGVMGLFDGADPVSDTGSSAQMAKWLGLPVLLILNAKGAGRTLAAMAQGLLAFDPDLRVLGLVCNNVGSARHAASLARSLAALCPGVPLLGCLPKDERVTLPSRHLGLHSAIDAPLTPHFLDALHAWVTDNLDLDRLLAALGLAEAGSVDPAGCAPAPVPNQASIPAPTSAAVTLHSAAVARLGVSYDQAFFFLAEDTLYRLREAGFDLVFFSPLHDAALPPDLDGLYLCGGYPELHAGTLGRNTAMAAAIRAFAASKRPLWAAGGGFLSLLKSLSGQPMAGVFPFAAVLENRLQALGYREITLAAPSLFGPAGTRLRANEFRYSRLTPPPDRPAGCSFLFTVQDAQGTDKGPEGFSLPDHPDLLGTFLHIHLASNPDAARHFADRAARMVHTRMESL